MNRRNIDISILKERSKYLLRKYKINDDLVNIMIAELRNYLKKFYKADSITFDEMFFTVRKGGGAKEIPYKKAAKDIPMYADLSVEEIKQIPLDPRKPHPHNTLISLGQNSARLDRLSCRYMPMRRSQQKKRDCTGTSPPDYYIDYLTDKNRIQVVEVDGNRRTIIWQHEYNLFACKGCTWKEKDQLGKMHVAFIAKHLTDRLMNNKNNQGPLISKSRSLNVNPALSYNSTNRTNSPPNGSTRPRANDFTYLFYNNTDGTQRVTNVRKNNLQKIFDLPNMLPNLSDVYLNNTGVRKFSNMSPSELTKILQNTTEPARVRQNAFSALMRIMTNNLKQTPKTSSQPNKSPSTNNLRQTSKASSQPKKSSPINTLDQYTQYATLLRNAGLSRQGFMVNAVPKTAKNVEQLKQRKKTKKKEIDALFKFRKGMDTTKKTLDTFLNTRGLQNNIKNQPAFMNKAKSLKLPQNAMLELYRDYQKYISSDQNRSQKPKVSAPTNTPKKKNNNSLKEKTKNTASTKKNNAPFSTSISQEELRKQFLKDADKGRKEIESIIQKIQSAAPKVTGLEKYKTMKATLNLPSRKLSVRELEEQVKIPRNIQTFITVGKMDMRDKIKRSSQRNSLENLISQWETVQKMPYIEAQKTVAQVKKAQNFMANLKDAKQDFDVIKAQKKDGIKTIAEKIRKYVPSIDPRRGMGSLAEFNIKNITPKTLKQEVDKQMGEVQTYVDNYTKRVENGSTNPEETKRLLGQWTRAQLAPLQKVDKRVDKMLRNYGK